LGCFKAFLNRQAPAEQSEEYVICGFFLLPFPWIFVEGFPDFFREEIYKEIIRLLSLANIMVWAEG
jgi:hypothetical protein